MGRASKPAPSSTKLELGLIGNLSPTDSNLPVVMGWSARITEAPRCTSCNNLNYLFSSETNWEFGTDPVARILARVLVRVGTNTYTINEDFKGIHRSYQTPMLIVLPEEVSVSERKAQVLPEEKVKVRKTAPIAAATVVAFPCFF